MLRRSSLLYKKPIELAYWTIYNTGGSNSDILITLISNIGSTSYPFLDRKDIGIIKPLETISFEAIKNKHVICVESYSSDGEPAITDILPTSFGYEEYMAQFGFVLPIQPNGYRSIIATELNPYIELVCEF